MRYRKVSGSASGTTGYDELEEEYYSQQEELLLEMYWCYGVTRG